MTNPLSQNLYTYVVNNPLLYTDPSGNQHIIDGSVSTPKGNLIYLDKLSQLELTDIIMNPYESPAVVQAAVDEFVRRNFLVVENGVLKVAEGVKIFVKSMKNILVNTHKATQNVVKTTKVGQWMSKTQYDQFVKTGIIPNSNVLTKGKKGYERQANKGNYYVEFDIDASLLMPKDIELGWAPVKSKNEMQLKLAKNKGITLPDPIGTNITHVDTKR